MMDYDIAAECSVSGLLAYEDTDAPIDRKDALRPLRQKRGRKPDVGGKADGIVALLRSDKARSHVFIAAEVGVSREYVRQVAMSRLGETGRQRQQHRRELQPAPVVSPWAGWHPLIFTGIVNRWYLGSGCAYCPGCHLIREMRRGPKQKREMVCAECNAARQRGRNRRLNQHNPLYGLGGIWFIKFVNRWLAEIGCRYCSGCHGVVDRFSRNYCRSCEARKQRETYARGREPKKNA